MGVGVGGLLPTSILGRCEGVHAGGHEWYSSGTDFLCSLVCILF